MKKILSVVVCTFLCLTALQSCYVMDPYQGFYGQPNMLMSTQVPNFGGNWNPYLNAVQPMQMMQNGWNTGWGMGMPWPGALLGGASFGAMPLIPYQWGFGNQGYPMYQNWGYYQPPQQRYHHRNQRYRRCR